MAASCRFMGISRQAVYQQRLRSQQRCDLLEPIKGLVLELRRYMPRLGTRKLYFLLKPKFEALNIKIGRDAFFDYLRHNDLLVKPKRSYTKTTYSKHWMKKHPNLLQEMKLKRVEQVLPTLKVMKVCIIYRWLPMRYHVKLWGMNSVMR